MRINSMGWVAALALVVVLLPGCDGIKKQLGLTKQSPDEFTVVKRAPLSVPPNFALRPPIEGAPRPQEGTTYQQARQTVFRIDDAALAAQERSRLDTRSLGEKTILARAGTDEIDENIRATVEQETGFINRNESNLLESLIYGDMAGEMRGVAIDPNAEAERLRRLQAEGQTLDGEEVPIIDRRRQGIFSRIFY